MDIELLGSPGVRGGDGVRRKVAGRQRALLALLALHAPRPVSADRLLDALWGDDQPADPANALQQRISALRKILDPDRRGDVLVTTAGGYALRIDDDRIDARRFARQAAAGSERLAGGDAAAAFEELRAALELWGGEPLEGFADEPWAVADARRLAELRLTAIEDRNDAALALGSGSELIGELTELIATHPLRERLAGQLMLALYRDGRQADALQVYDGTRHLLADELGVDPGPALQAVYRRVLDQDASLQAPSGPSPATTTKVDNLPAAAQPLVGREDALDRLDDLLGQRRLVTVTGPGGTGKTTLAVEVARRRPRPVHGTWLVQLAPLRGSDAIVGELARVLGVGSSGLGAAGFDGAGLAAALAERQLLLVLDNCEHVVEPVASLVEQLLAAAPGLTVLATSREPLGVPGEQVWPLPALEVPAPDAGDAASIVAAPAVQLLLERVRQHDPWFDLSPSDTPIAGALVRGLDGIPLAIELAAAQLRVLSLAELTASLEDRFALLATGVRGAPERQRTLRGALDWSWDLLDHGQRRAWAALAVPAAGFDQDTAARLLAAAGYDGHHLVALRELVDRSLLSADTDVVPARYRMLETIRVYGRDQLEALGLLGPVATAHAELVEEALAACHAPGDPARFGVDLGGLAAWLDDARVALGWAVVAGDRGRVQRIAGLLGWAWLLRGLTAEGIGWLDRGLGIADGGDPMTLDPATVEPAAALWASGLRLERAHADGPRWAEIALAAVTEPSDHVVAGVYAAIHHAHAGRLDDCWGQLAAARAEAEGIGGWPLGFCALMSAQLGRLTGRFDRVRSDVEQALELLVDPGLAWTRAYAIDIAIDVVLDDPGAGGGYERARDLARDGLALCSGQGMPELEARLRLQLGRALHELGDVEQARRHLDDAVQLAASAGRGAGLGFALLASGSMARQRGEVEVAMAQLRDALDLLQATGAPYGEVGANVELALAARAGGDACAAVDHAGRAVSLAHRMGDPGMLARALEVRAAAAGGGEDPDAGAVATLLGTASAVRQRVGARLDPTERRDLDSIAGELRARFGSDLDAQVREVADGVGDRIEAAVAEVVARYGADEDTSTTGP